MKPKKDPLIVVASAIKLTISIFIVVMAIYYGIGQQVDSARVFGRAAMSIFIIYCLFWPIENYIKRHQSTLQNDTDKQ